MLSNYDHRTFRRGRDQAYIIDRGVSQRRKYGGAMIFFKICFKYRLKQKENFRSLIINYLSEKKFE